MKGKSRFQANAAFFNQGKEDVVGQEENNKVKKGGEAIVVVG
jgi:hypothetical protein